MVVVDEVPSADIVYESVAVVVAAVRVDLQDILRVQPSVAVDIAVIGSGDEVGGVDSIQRRGLGSRCRCVVANVEDAVSVHIVGTAAPPWWVEALRG